LDKNLIKFEFKIYKNKVINNNSNFTAPSFNFLSLLNLFKFY
jgi:hypothetical protein